ILPEHHILLWPILGMLQLEFNHCKLGCPARVIENVIVSLVVKWLGNMMNEVDIENLTIEQYVMLTQESQTQGMVRTEFGRMITKDIKDMTITEYMEYEAEIKKNPRGYAKSYTRNLGSTNLREKEVSSNEDVDEWLNAEMSKRVIGQDKEEEHALINILKTVVEECKSIYKKAQIPSSRTSKILGVSFVAEEEEGKSSETLLCKQQSNEINPKGFTLPCTISNLNIYDVADVGAGINMMPKSLFEHLKLINLKKTSMVVEMVDMTKKAPLGIVENIPLKIDKFLFRSDFVIDVFKGEISLGIGNKKVKFDTNGEICHSRVPHEKIYMASSIQKGKYFNPHEVKNDDSPTLEQRTLHYSEESIDTVDYSDDSQEDEVGSHLLDDVVSRWHVCKPAHVTFKVCEEDYRIWPTCNPDLSFCSGYDAIYEKEKNGMLKQWVCFRDQERQSVGGNGMKFADFLKVRYGNKNIDDITRERRYYEWVAQNYDFNTTKYVDQYDSHHE
ncbi:phospholipase-like protein, partial [Tanacetum coccineum]